MIDYEDILKKNIYYLDFESNKKGDLFLLGVEVKRNFTCYVINQDLSPICENENYKENFNIQYRKPKDIISKLLSSMSEDNDVIVAYSIPELEIIQKQISKEKLPNINYLNLARIARAWKNKFHKEAFDKLPELRKHSSSFIAKKNSLASITRLLSSDKHAPTDYAPGKTTSRINSVLSGLRVHKKFSDLTNTQKSKTTRFLKHNHYDVVGMRYLLEQIINDDPKLIRKAIYKLTDNKSSPNDKKIIIQN